MKDIPLAEYFKYHPPITAQRKAAHEEINQAALAFAEAIDSAVKDEDCKKMAVFAVQQARMFANQGITVDELRWADEPPTSYLVGWRDSPPDERAVNPPINT